MKLRRELRLLDVYCLATGAMISSGIFVLPGLAHAKAGPSAILSYAIAGCLAGIGILNAAELATAMPKAGGDYYFITRSLGPAVGSISGMLNWFSISLKSAFALVGMAAFLRLFIDVDPRITGIILCAVFVGTNLSGAKHAGRVQTVLVLLLLLIMAAYVVTGLPHVSVANLQPFTPHGLNNTLATAGFVFVAFGGLIKISSIGEEVRDPSRTLPRGMLLSLTSVVALYILMIFVTTGVMSSDTLDNSLTPITDGAAVFMGTWGARAVGLAAVLAFVSTANAGIMAASRYLYALSQDELLPRTLGRLSRKSGVPTAAVLVTGCFVAASLFLKLEILVEAASLVLILGFILSCVCVIVLRESHVQNYRPSFRAPLYPGLQVVGVLGFGLLVFEMGLEAFIICTAVFVIGTVSYWTYARKRVKKDYALLHLIERLTDQVLVTGSLERELKEVVRERDEIVLDRFDKLISRAVVLDIPEQADMRGCFTLVADRLAERMELDRDALAARLIEREEQTSTLLTPFLAIPHVVVPGSDTFEIALVRAKKGVVFSESAPGVSALFFLVGTLDQRNFHLRALASIAQIVQEGDFETRWMNARDEDGIRDVVLLGKRLREGVSTVKD
ncbi:MAG: amino acid permease [Chitinivibrionales bacterium]|nr:amino acid permease [Chitinivibrionales bacterium]